jgi:hypothetical protein
MGIYENAPWWTREEDPHATLWPLCERIEGSQASLTENTRRLMSVYEYGYKDGIDVHQHGAPLTDTVLAYNHAQNAVNTVHSRITAQQIALMPMTEGGSYEQRQRAKQLGKALDGELDESGRTRIDYDVTLDYLITDHGYGAAYVCSDFGRVRVEHVPAEEVYDDEAEQRYGAPRSRYRRMEVDRYVLLERYGTAPEDGKEDPYHGTWQERREAIERAESTLPTIRGEMSSDRIKVWLAWHLPSRPSTDEAGEWDGSDDGKHALVLPNCTLEFRPWNRERFPIVKCIPRRRPRTTLGMSLMRQLAAPQREHEKLSQRIQLAHHHIGGTGIVAEKGAGVSEADITNGQGTYTEVNDGYISKVKEFNPAPVNPQTYDYCDRVERKMYEANGISRFAAQSQVPSGLSQASGKALQVFEDQEDKSLRPFYVARDEFHVEIAWAIVDEVRDIVKANPDYTAKHKGKSGRVELIPWKEILQDKNDFAITVFPVSLLSKAPAAKFAQLTELLNAQAITIQQFKRLFGLPDLEAENAMDTADEDLIDSHVDGILLHGKTVVPEPFDNLTLMVERGRKSYRLYSQPEYEIPESRLKMLREYIASAQSMLDEIAAKERAATAEANATAMPPPPDPNMPPPGAPPPGMPPDGGGEPMPPPEAVAAMDPAMMAPGMAA